MSDYRSRLERFTDQQRAWLADRLSQRIRSSRLLAFVTQKPGTNTEDMTESSLKDFLRERLPSHLIPSGIELRHELPRLPNGKIDRRSLKQQPTATAPIESETLSENELKLLAIWKDVLGAEEISLDDDFFTIGGDSILSIQIISQARTAGIRLQPSDFADTPTIRHLASLTNPDESSQENIPDQTNQTISLAPIQQWFFDLKLNSPEHWNLGVLIKIPQELERSMIPTLVDALLESHSALQLGYKNTENNWRANRARHPPIQFITLDSNAPVEIETRLVGLHESFDLKGGSLVRFGHVRTPSQDYLAVIAHHLIIDRYSLEIIAEDVTTGSENLLNSGTPDLAAPTARFEQYTRRSDAQARDEIVFWSPNETTSLGRLPWDHQYQEKLIEGDSRVLSAKFSHSRSEQLFSGANSAYATRTNDLLLAALTGSMKHWTGKKDFRIGLEHHGRDLDAIDLSRTVGWFTTYFPFRVTLNSTAATGELVKEVKEQLRAILRQGVGYGQLRYGGDNQIQAQVSRDEGDEDILFNYSGLSSPRFKANTRLLTLGARAKNNHRTHLLEIYCRSDGNTLITEWIYNQRAHSLSTIENWIQDYFHQLGEILDHCLAQGSGFTPSDFPETDISQEDLDTLLDRH